jgi:polyhydroxyalkanoate synthesis repressor PhaR
MIAQVSDIQVETLPQPGVIVYKRYQNRKLYDSNNSRYATLIDIYETMKSGRKLQVVNASTNEDITITILLHALLEKGRGQPSVEVVNLLNELTTYLKGEVK